MATLEINELHEPALFMGVRRESDEIAAMVGARRREDPSRILCDTSQGSNAEYARQSGDIAARSRSLINNAGWGDNLEVMREKIPDEVADLIYLDPPFNSSRSYNLLFRQVKGDPSPAQIHAFEDAWIWSPLLYEQFGVMAWIAWHNARRPHSALGYMSPTEYRAQQRNQAA